MEREDRVVYKYIVLRTLIIYGGSGRRARKISDPNPPSNPHRDQVYRSAFVDF